MKALIGAFNQEKALVGAFSVIVKTDCETMDRFTALVEAVASSVASLPATIYTYFFPDSDPQCSCGQTMPRDEHGHRVKRAINGEETGENQYPWQAG